MKRRRSRDDDFLHNTKRAAYVQSQYWVLFTNPSFYGIDDLLQQPDQTVRWGNMKSEFSNNLIQLINEGDQLLLLQNEGKNFLAGELVAKLEAIGNPYPDLRQFDQLDKHYDKNATKENPIWYVVDIRLKEILRRKISLKEIKYYAPTILSSIESIQKQGVLSTILAIITHAQFQFITRLSLCSPSTIEIESIVQPNTPNISPMEIQIIKKLGQGSFGEVFLAKCRGKEVAVKVLRTQHLIPEKLEEFKREVKTLNKNPHPNIVQFLGACYEPGNMCLVMEFLPRGDMKSMLLENKVKLGNLTRIKMIKDTALGMNWLHSSSPQLLHRDLKPENLLIDQSTRIKICDFGFAVGVFPSFCSFPFLQGLTLFKKQVKDVETQIKDPASYLRGTPTYMAPELLANQPFDERIDVYSFGLVMWSIISRQIPFQKYLQITDIKEAFSQFKKAVCEDHERPIIDSSCPEIIEKLIRRCWHSDYTQRPYFKDILPILDDAIIEVAIRDPIGRFIWKNSELCGLETVSWTKFISVFYKELKKQFQFDEQSYSEQVRELNIACLYELLIGEVTPSDGISEYTVSIERFGWLLDWFGPLINIDPSGTNKVVLIDSVRELLSNRWFHGDIDQRTAEFRLNSQDTDGAFLVRFSSQLGYFTISSLDNKTVVHRRITCLSGGFSVPCENKIYSSLSSLITANSTRYKLVTPCGGSRFAKLIAQQENFAYLVN